jgi:hypothetical protein
MPFPCDVLAVAISEATSNTTPLDPFVKGILVAVLIPIMLVALTAILQALAQKKSIELKDSTNIAVDLIFVSIGGAGVAFNAPSPLGFTWGIDARTGLEFVIVLDILLAATLLYIRQNWGDAGVVGTLFNLTLGTATVVLIGIIIPYMG